LNIVVSPYNPDWLDQFQSLHDVIWSEVSDVAISIEHVGSTSVPGLAAKPIIDMTIVVKNDEALEEVVNRLSRIGVQHRGDLGIVGREAFTRLSGFPEHNLYACMEGAQALRNHLGIRDYLREYPESAIKYGELKYALAKKYPQDIDAYVAGKSEFLLTILTKLGFSESDLEEIENVNQISNSGFSKKPPGI